MRCNDIHVAGKFVCLKGRLDEFCVTRIILQQKNVQGVADTALILPGGGSLIMAQRTPSSFTALTNS